MTVELDPVIRVGTVAAAAMTRCVVERGPGHAAALVGSKRPVAVLVRHGDVTLAFDESGAWMAPDVFEQRFPGRWAEFERITMMSLKG